MIHHLNDINYIKRDFHLKFPFSKWEFGGRPCDLLRMTCQGQTFFDEVCPLRTLILKKTDVTTVQGTCV